MMRDGLDVIDLVGLGGQRVDSVAFVDETCRIQEDGWAHLVGIAGSLDGHSICFGNFAQAFYFFVSKGRMTVAQSLKTLSALRLREGLPVEIDRDACQAYRDAGLVLPPFTIFRDMFQIPLFSTMRRGSNGFVLEFTGVVSTSESTSFKDDDDVFGELQRLVEERLDGHLAGTIVCTLSGGADSAALLSVVQRVADPSRIRTLTCRMPGFDGEVDRARRVSHQCGITNYVYRPDNVAAEPVLDEYVNRFGNLVYDPVVPVLTSMFRACAGDVATSRRVFVVDGQGADTMLAGLPHNAALALYWRPAAPLFRLLTTVLPQPTEWLRDNFRPMYRAIKTARLLAEPTWTGALLCSLDFERANYPVYYGKLESILRSLERRNSDRQKAIMVFFLLILQSREMQKYQLLPNGFEMVLPFMDRRFIERCYLTPTNLFMRRGKRKIPITRRVMALFPDLFSTVKTTPFAVQYTVKRAGRARDGAAKAGHYAELKEYCIDALSTSLRKDRVIH